MSVAGDLVDGRYRLGRRLGGGHDTDVFMAEDLPLARTVVLRIAGPAGGAALARQTRCLTSLQFDTANTVPVLDEGATEDGGRYFAMPFIEGTPLSSLTARRGALPPDEAASIAIQLLEAAIAARRIVPSGLHAVPESAILDRDRQVRVTWFRDEPAGAGQDPACASTATVLHDLLTGVAPSPGTAVAERGQTVPDELAHVVDDALTGGVRTPEEFIKRLADARRRLPQPAPESPPPLRNWQMVVAVLVLLVTVGAIILAVTLGTG